MNELLARHLVPSQIIIDLMIVCIVIGAIDYQRGNKWGLGQKFVEGFSAFFPLLMMMGGIITITPLMGKIMSPVLTPLFQAFGADPGTFPGMIFSCAMGGYSLSKELASEPMAADFGGMILGSIMGINIVFNIPVALGLIEPEDRAYMARGFLFGFITIPIGAFCGGLIAGWPVEFLLINLIPVTVVSVLIGILIRFVPGVLIRIFISFGKYVAIVALTGVTVAIVADLAQIDLKPFHLDSIQTDLEAVGAVIIVLPGAYVMVELISRYCRSVLLKAGACLGINEMAALGLISSLANIIPTLSIIKKMDPKGKVVNFAFASAGAFTFGDHLGFCVAVAPHMLIPVIVAKMTAASLAVLLVILFVRK